MEKHLRTAETLAFLLDNSFNFFGKRFGLNGLLGLIPWVGDIVTGILSFYIFWIGVQMRLPVPKLAETLRNVIFNFVIGLIPIAGDFVDFFHKANTRNVQILREHANKTIIEGEVLDSSRSVVI